MKNDISGPAYPVTEAQQRYPDLSGMSLRDYFAGQALAGMDEVADASRMAEWAYRIADAMLEARKGETA